MDRSKFFYNLTLSEIRKIFFSLKYNNKSCFECGGKMSFSTGSGRIIKYRGCECKIPNNLEFFKCDDCGSYFLDSKQLKELSDNFEEQIKFPLQGKKT